MANEWLRLWHDMPTDPKWRTIARVSGESIALVQALYIHLLVDASRNVTRGHVDVTTEDLASALDVTETQIESILSAMQGRVIDGNELTGWAKRQPKKEDAGNPETLAKSAAERKRLQREREKLAAQNNDKNECHDASRNVTLDKDKEEDKENIKTKEKSESVENVNTDNVLFPHPENETARPAKQKKPKSEEITFNQFIEKCLSDNLEPIPANHAVIRWAEASRIPENFIIVAWEAFKAKHVNDNKKRQADWPATFYNYCKLDYLKVWAFDREGTPYLTTAGKNFEKGLTCER